jgi:tetratricopeptide (TPR) repeat protein
MPNYIMMEDEMKKIIVLILLVVFPLFIVLGCSTTLSEKDIVQFFSSTRKSQNNPDSHYLLACDYQEKGRHRKAIDEFEKVLLIEPNYVEAYNGIGVSYDLLGDFLKAIEYYETALRLNPNLAYVYNNIGYSNLLQRNLDEAISLFKMAIALNDQHKKVHDNLGLAYIMKGQMELAITEFELGADEASARYNIARFCYERGFYHMAKIHYARALSLDPSFTNARTGLEAADALSTIFERDTKRIEEEELITQEESAIGKTKSQELKAPIQSTAVKAEVEQSVIHDQRGATKRVNLLKGVGIEISNGNGVNRNARKVGNYLKGKGFNVIRLTNANHFKQAGTRIYYQKEYNEAADCVAEQLPVFQDMIEVKGFDHPNIKVKVVIGKDLIPHNKLFADNS